MKETIIDQDIITVGVQAKTFPMGVMDAYKTLHHSVPYATTNTNYGISHGTDNGITYIAAVEQQQDNEALPSGCVHFTIKAGRYAEEIHENVKGNEAQFQVIFQKLLQHPELDPNGYCVEIYGDHNDARCLVKLKDQ